MATRHTTTWTHIAALLLAAALVFAAGTAHAVYEVDIYSPGLERFTIGIADFKNTSDADAEKPFAAGMREILVEDLKLSGLFNVIDRTMHLEEPDAGLKLGEFKFEDWQLLRADSLVKAGFVIEGDTLTLEMRYFDVFGQRQLLGKRYTGKREDHPDMIHRFANEIIFLLTGEKGIFGTRVAFVSKKSGHKEIYTIGIDGRKLSRVTSLGTITLSPSWSPDGAWLSYSSYVNDQPFVFKAPTRGGKPIRISDRPGLNLGAEWSPDGKSLALTLSKDGNSELYEIDARGRIQKRLTTSPAIEVSPSWSPSGKHIAFVSDRGGSPQVYVMDADGKNQRRLTFTGSYNVAPAWSPKGDQILFQGLEAGTYQIYVTTPDGSQVYRVSDGVGSNEGASWSPDGRAIVYTSNRTGSHCLYIATIDGSYTKQLTSGGWDDTSPAWSPRLLE